MNSNIPSEYQPFERLTICSNVLIKTGSIIKIGSIDPILIGKGLKLPAIWIRARADRNNWISVVERSISLSAQIQIINDIRTSTTTVRIKDKVILVAQQLNNECIVSEIDLRPLGLIIYGDSDMLKVGNGEFKGNTMQGVGAFIGFNE